MISRQDQYNQPESILVITSYPDPESGIRDLNAVAWHSQKTLKSLSKSGQKFIVLAEKTAKSKNNLEDGNILVLRAYSRGNFLTLLSLIRYIFKFNRVKRVLVQFEFNIFGSILSTLLFPLVLLATRLSGKRIYFELHQVVANISTLAPHINIKSSKIVKIFNWSLSGYYKFIAQISESVIVFEEELKKTFFKLTASRNVVTIPLSTQSVKIGKKSVEKKKLGFSGRDFVIVAFGFINWYKGSDWIAELVARRKQTTDKLILAGGESPTLKNKKYYQKFYSRVAAISQKSPNITLTGFLTDKKVRSYLSAADLVILPYRVFMSTSGPFSQALSYKKPILLSTKLAPYFKNADFLEATKKYKIKKEKLMFSLTDPSFKKSLNWAKKNKKKMISFYNYLSQKRSAKEVNLAYLTVLNSGLAKRGNYAFYLTNFRKSLRLTP